MTRDESRRHKADESSGKVLPTPHPPAQSRRLNPSPTSSCCCGVMGGKRAGQQSAAADLKSSSASLTTLWLIPTRRPRWVLEMQGLTALISQTLSVSLELGLFLCSLSPGFSCFYNSIWTQGWFSGEWGGGGGGGRRLLLLLEPQGVEQSLLPRLRQQKFIDL